MKNELDKTTTETKKRDMYDDALFQMAIRECQGEITDKRRMTQSLE